jgi:hypothetical protein
MGSILWQPHFASSHAQHVNIVTLMKQMNFWPCFHKPCLYMLYTLEKSYLKHVGQRSQYTQKILIDTCRFLDLKREYAEQRFRNSYFSTYEKLAFKSE